MLGIKKFFYFLFGLAMLASGIGAIYLLVKGTTDDAGGPGILCLILWGIMMYIRHTTKCPHCKKVWVAKKIDDEDLGVSSYLRERMLNGASYKGFGLSAQSMSRAGVSYNLGKLSSDPRRDLNPNGYPAAYTYLLPAREWAAKYMAISAYHGSFSPNKLLEMGIDPVSLNDTLEFCFSQGLLARSDDDRVVVTKEGFKYYGAVFSLFF